MIWQTSALARAYRVLSAAAAFLVGATVAQAAPVTGEATYYYSGDTRVDVVLALDEVRIKGSGAGPLPGEDTLRRASSRVLSAQRDRSGAGGTNVELVPAADRRELAQEIRTLRQGIIGAEVQPVLYLPENAADRAAQGRRMLTSRMAVKLVDGQKIEALASKYGLRVARKVEYSAGTWILEASAAEPLASLEAANRLYETERVEWATPMVERVMTRRAVTNDPLFPNQWHLKNTGSNASGAVAGNDVNIPDAWNSYNGSGVTIAITDDGLQQNHPDLSANVRTTLGKDFNGDDTDPSPGTYDSHGTACAGVAAGVGNNSLGSTGAGYGAKLVGVRLIAGSFSDQDEADAMTWLANPSDPNNTVHINSNSWGPSDDGSVMAAPGPLMASAFEYAATHGRGGKGTLFTWAGGNGRQPYYTGDSPDYSNYDGWTSSRFVIGVGASGADGTVSYYSESGSALLVNAPSSYSYGGITTTDRTGSDGYSSTDYTDSFGGTSSACPLVAGVLSLALQANPNLTWRDVQHLLVLTSTKNSPTDSDWKTNGAGNSYNHKFGFGRINASALVAKAATWKTVPAEAAPLTAASSETGTILDNNPTGLTRSLTVSGDPYFKTEAVEVTVNVSHSRRGDLRLTLTSPSGMVSVLGQSRKQDTAANMRFTFTSKAHWGENPNGVWQVNFADRRSVYSGTLNSVQIKVHGYIGASAECENRYGCFVDRQYLDFLKRGADAGGHAYWTDSLCNGLVTPELVVRNFIASDEFAGNRGFAARCYFGMYNNNMTTNYATSGYRIPDKGGLDYWTGVMASVQGSGGSLRDAKKTVVSSFMSAPEWTSRVGNPDNSGFVDFLYENILGRAPEPGGKTHHLNNLNAGLTTRADLVVDFLDSLEAQAKYANMTYVCMAYLGLLDRGAETGGFIYHTNRLNAGTVNTTTFLSEFIYSAEYLNRIASLSCPFPPAASAEGSSRLVSGPGGEEQQLAYNLVQPEENTRLAGLNAVVDAAEDVTAEFEVYAYNEDGTAAQVAASGLVKIAAGRRSVKSPELGVPLKAGTLYAVGLRWKGDARLDGTVTATLSQGLQARGSATGAGTGLEMATINTEKVLPIGATSASR